MAQIKTIRSYDNDTGISTCTLKYKDETYIGETICYPEDKDMKNEFTGLAISQMKAERKFLKARLREARIKLKTLNSLRDKLTYCSNFIHDRNNSIVKQIEIECRNVAQEVADYHQAVLTKDIEIKQYITEKDSFYKLIRKNRKDKTI